MQTFGYRHNSGFQPFSRRFLARIKFQMPVVRQRSRIRIVYWWHIHKQPFHPPEKGTGNWVHITFFQGRLLPGGAGGHRPYAMQVWNMTQTDKLQPFSTLLEELYGQNKNRKQQSISKGLYSMLALYEVVKYLCLEMGISVLYIN